MCVCVCVCVCDQTAQVQTFSLYFYTFVLLGILKKIRGFFTIASVTDKNNNLIEINPVQGSIENIKNISYLT